MTIKNKADAQREIERATTAAAAADQKRRTATGSAREYWSDYAEDCRREAERLRRLLVTLPA